MNDKLSVMTSFIKCPPPPDGRKLNNAFNMHCCHYCFNRPCVYAFIPSVRSLHFGACGVKSRARLGDCTVHHSHCSVYPFWQHSHIVCCWSIHIKQHSPPPPPDKGLWLYYALSAFHGRLLGRYCKRWYFRGINFLRFAAQKHIRGLLNSRWADAHLSFLYCTKLTSFNKWYIYKYVCNWAA